MGKTTRVITDGLTFPSRYLQCLGWGLTPHDKERRGHVSPHLPLGRRSFQVPQGALLPHQARLQINAAPLGIQRLGLIQRRLAGVYISLVAFI